jgi:hypothetical protein
VTKASPLNEVPLTVKRLLITIAAIAVIMALVSIQYIPSGRRGAVARRGKIDVLDSGIHFSPP